MYQLFYLMFKLLKDAFDAFQCSLLEVCLLSRGLVPLWVSSQMSLDPLLISHPGQYLNSTLESSVTAPQ